MSYLVAGIDEVGRGALAGPLVAVASLFHSPAAPLPGSMNNPYWETRYTPIPGVNDSKKLTAKKRREVFHRILRDPSLVDFGLGEASVDEINVHGIDWANRVVFERAMKDLRWQPHHVLIDGDNPLFGWSMMDQKHEPRGDGLWWPVGAASILAKVIRDSYMEELSDDHPEYCWERNSGYGSDLHRGALIDFGATPHHRTKFIRNFVRGDRNGY